MTGDVKKYHPSLRIMHWLMAALIIGMIALGWYMSDLTRDNPLKATLVSLHKSFGSLVLILFFVRVAIRLFTKIPPLPLTIAFIERFFANIGHKFLYVFIGIVPLSGYAMSNFYGYTVNLFGLPLPKIFPTNKELAGLAHDYHKLLPYILLAIIIGHVAAVIRHRFFDKPENDVLGRML